MKRYTDQKPIRSIVRRENTIDPKPEYQTGPRWSKKQKQLLMDTILRDLDIPKFYLRVLHDGNYEFEVVDGQQRLRAIWEFARGEYRIAKDAEPVDGHEVSNKSFDELPADLQDKFDGYNLHITVLDDCAQDDVEEMFVRLQNGTTLKAAEKRNALPGKMKEFVRALAEHEFFARCGFKNRRRDFDQVAAQCVLLETHGGIRNIKNQDLEKMYLDNIVFDDSSDVARRVHRVLNYLGKMFPVHTPQLRQHNVISLYLLISMLLKKYVVADLADQIGKWFVAFESKRLAELDLPEDQRDPEMVAYQNAVGHSSDSVDSLVYRGKIISRAFFADFPGITPLDHDRDFSDEQRMAIFWRDGGVCQLKIRCTGRKLGWDDNWHADHLTPHSRGGKTTVENGRVACADCNLARSNNE